MKKMMLVLGLLTGSLLSSIEAQQVASYKVITVVESIVPAGLGRSRIIENQTEMDVSDFTTNRTDGKKSNQGDIKRSDAKIDQLDESKLLNFYSLAGINFQNIASNDALITSKLNKMSQDGWDLVFVTSGVESDSGETDGNGIYVTRFIFKKM